MASFATAGPVLYAFSLGLAGAVNPCGFPLLPAYLVVAATDAGPAPLALRWLRALSSGLSASIGIIVTFAVVGGVLAAGVDLAESWIPWVMIPVGVVCAVIGILAVSGRALPGLHVPRLFAGDRRRVLALGGFGVAYAVGSLSCTLPLFLSGVVDTFTGRGAGIGLASGLAYGLGMSLIITAVSLAGASSTPVRLRRLRALQPALQRIAGVLLVVVGAYLVLYWVTDLTSPFTVPAPVRAVESVQAAVATAISSSPRVTGVVIGAVVLAVLVVASLRGARPAQAAAPRPTPQGAARPGGTS